MMELIDVTIRDGGYLNGHRFQENEISEILMSLNYQDISNIEVGYLSPTNTSEVNMPDPLMCHREYIESLQKYTSKVFSIMVRKKKGERRSFEHLRNTRVKLVRFVCRPDNIDCLGEDVRKARAVDLKISLNLINAGLYSMERLMDMIDELSYLDPDYICIADSNSSLVPRQVAVIFRRLKGKYSRFKFGFHAHDGRSLAYINTITAIENGAETVDASIAGMGKHGNLDLSLVGMYLQSTLGKTFDFMKLYDVARGVIEKWTGPSYKRFYESAMPSFMNMSFQNTKRLISAYISEREAYEVLCGYFRNETNLNRFVRNKHATESGLYIL